MRIGVVGAGGAGLVASWLLQDEHEVEVFEAADRPGGHLDTTTVEADGGPVEVELGAQFFFREGYSGLHALLARLGRTPTPIRLGLSVTPRDGGAPFVLPPLDLAAARSIASPTVLRRLYWFLRFGWGGEDVVREADWSVSVQALVDRIHAPRAIADGFLIPFVASSWGVPMDAAREMSAYSVTRVMGVRPTRLPHSHRVPGGLGGYAHALVADAPRIKLHLNTPVHGLRPAPQGGLELDVGERRARFDAVILACDWRASAAACRDAPALAPWHQAFAAFEDYDATVVVHRDSSVMPADRRLWHSANHDHRGDAMPRNTVWAGQPSGADVFRTWLRPDESPPRDTIEVRRFKHILMVPQHRARQEAVARLQGTSGLWAVGMYTDGIDNHESAIRSAAQVARSIAPEAQRVRWLAERVSR